MAATMPAGMAFPHNVDHQDNMMSTKRKDKKDKDKKKKKKKEKKNSETTGNFEFPTVLV